MNAERTVADFASLVALAQELRARVEVLEGKRLAEVKALRISRRDAAAMLRVCSRTVATYQAMGLLVPLDRPNGEKGGGTVFYHPDNVKALGESRAAAANWVANRKFCTKRGK